MNDSTIPQSDNDALTIKYMHRCLQLAQYGVSYVAPNPMVGAVVVCNDVIIGEGYHRHYALCKPGTLFSLWQNTALRRSYCFLWHSAGGYRYA